MTESKYSPERLQNMASDLPKKDNHTMLPHLRRIGDPADPLYKAWEKNAIAGLENNQKMFNSTLQAFRAPYWMTVGMYGLLFALGFVAFAATLYLGLCGVSQVPVIVFGGLTAVTFIGFFIRHPLQALEDNLEFMAWLGGIYNTYWVRLLYAQDPKRVQNDLKIASTEFNNSMARLIRLHATIRKLRPGETLQVDGSDGEAIKPNDIGVTTGTQSEEPTADVKTTKDDIAVDTGVTAEQK